MTIVKQRKDSIDKGDEKKTARVDHELVNKAMEALLKYHDKTKDSKQLLGSDLPIQVQIGLDRVPQNPSPKPIRVIIPNPIHAIHSEKEKDHVGLEEPEVCLIVKEESKPRVQDMIAQVPQHMKCIKKVMGLNSLRRKHKQYEQRRDLLARYDLFLADDRILPMLGKCLGKNFFKTKKQPIPIRVSGNEALPIAIQKCLSATFMYLSPGTCMTIRAGNTGMPREKLVENVEAIAENAVRRIPRKWANVRSISIKTTQSTALPVYNKTADELVEIAKMAGLKQSSVEQAQEVEKENLKKRKNVLSSKSPLVRALKKQKESDEKEGADELKNDKEKIPTLASDELRTKEKKPRKQTDAVSSKKAPKNVPTSTNAGQGQETSGRSQKFMSSKKYVGSKPGYVFKNGPEGVGYYVDEIPIPDKMALEALARMASSSRTKRSGRKKHRGKR